MVAAGESTRGNIHYEPSAGFCYSSEPGLRPRSLAPKLGEPGLLIRQELFAKFFERFLLSQSSSRHANQARQAGADHENSCRFGHSVVYLASVVEAERRARPLCHEEMQLVVT
jgi:hypothetical protein